MASLRDGLILSEHITTVLNNLIISKGKQLDKNEKAIWDDFLHELTNDEWESMFMAFKHLVDKHNILLTDHQQRKFDEAYMTFQKDKLKRERCMDIRNKFMNTKNLAWSMIMIIREIHNLTTNTDVANVDKPKQAEVAPPQPGKKRKINIHATIEIWEDLFDSE